MLVKKGKGVCRTAAIGRLLFYERGSKKVRRIKTEDSESEIERYKSALKRAEDELEELYKKALSELDH